MTVLTGIDLPYPSPGGSVELLRDLYLGQSPLISADVFMLGQGDSATARARNAPTLLPVAGKALSGSAFWSYVDRLTAAVRTAFADFEYSVLHLQHLAFGATPALLRAFPEVPKIALVHGTDLLFAAQDRTQAEVLREVVRTATVIVVPTGAMADRLRQLAPVSPDRVVRIPWGVPDSLLLRPLAGSPRPPGVLRVLYAGRLTPEKATSQVIAAVAGLDGIELGVAAPATEFAALAGQADLSRVRYLGWLSREKLWSEFGDHDLLMMPSLKLEAFGLVAVEAQACGLPVAYQAVPGLAEVLGDSALAIDFGDMDRLVIRLKELSASPTHLDELRAAGIANSARFPLSETARAINELSLQVTDRVDHG